MCVARAVRCSACLVDQSSLSDNGWKLNSRAQCTCTMRARGGGDGRKGGAVQGGGGGRGSPVPARAGGGADAAAAALSAAPGGRRRRSSRRASWRGAAEGIAALRALVASFPSLLGAPPPQRLPTPCQVCVPSITSSWHWGHPPVICAYRRQHTTSSDVLPAYMFEGWC